MYQDIRNNKIKTGFIVSLFIIVIALIIYYICMAFDLGYMSIIIAMVFSIGSAWASYYYSDKIVLSINRAHPASPEEYQKLNNILDGLMVSSGLEHRPRLYVLNDPQPNAFATGRNPKNAVICVTTGLLEKMDYYELEGVVAHELSHIKNYDILLSTIVSVFVGFVVIVSDFALRLSFWGRGSDDNENRGSLGIIMFIVGLIFLILSPLFTKLIQLAISRKREYLADATAVEFTRNPNGLISALKKLQSDTTSMRNVSKATAHMYINDPDKKKREKTDIFSTHPPISERIARLEHIN